MVSEWNKNIATVFSATWIVYLDDSMSIRHGKWLCPGWVLSKPHPFGNGYHSACYGVLIMCVVEMVEGKDHLTNLEHPNFEECGKTGVLLL